VTRKTIINMVNAMPADLKMPKCSVRNISLAEIYAADEVFTTGMAKNRKQSYASCLACGGIYI
jgi:hypothetical protein